jgi:hypothetical protein
MAMAGVLHLWSGWEIQIMVLVSFALQVLLLSFAWMRRRSISAPLRILLWLTYLLAEYTATYTLGHISMSCKEGELLMALWAQFLLVHLGGQDTITAYAMEDNQLWLRHLLTFSVQALGAAYVLYKNIGGSRGPLLVPAVLMFLVGVLKNTERVWALGFSRLEIIRRYLDGVSVKQDLKPYYYPAAPAASQPESDVESGLFGCCPRLGMPARQAITAPGDRNRTPGDAARLRSSLGGSIQCPTGPEPELQCTTGPEPKLLLDDEWVLQGAHDLLYICMGQFVDDKIWATKFQNDAMKLFRDKSKTFELVEMQLSLMYDIFYTKAAVIHTWYGRCVRALSLIGTVMAFFLFQFSTATDGHAGYRRVDARVTYVLILGALILETASLLRAVGSTWTCAMLKVTKWDRLHRLHVSLRRWVRIAQTRRWSGSIGQLSLLASYSYNGADSPGTGRHKMASFWRDGSRSRIPTGAKELVLKEIQRLVKACKGEEAVMRSYRGQCALERLAADDQDGFLKDLDLTWSTSMEFDQSILAWHLATDKFLRGHSKSADAEARGLVEATKAVSNYMMFLLVERPYMLPSPVRPTLHLKARQELKHYSWFTTSEALNPGAKLADQLLSIKETEEKKQSEMLEKGEKEAAEKALNFEAKLADQLLPPNKKGEDKTSETLDANKLLRVVFGVWVEMLCYAAHHCSRESHARQLNDGGEFLTIVWLLTTAEFNHVNYNEGKFKVRNPGSIWNFMNVVNFTDFVEYYILMPLFAIFRCIFRIFRCIFRIFRCIFRIFCCIFVPCNFLTIICLWFKHL